MNVNWEKRYSFRLQSEDEQIFNLLAQVPENKRSETIRQMLRFAVRTILEGQKVNKENQSLIAEVKSLRESLEKQHEELLLKISSSPNLRNDQVAVSEDEATMTEEAIDDSASAMLSSFGIEF